MKQHDEWGDPAVCDSGDECQYCHTRTEQQFYPEVSDSKVTDKQIIMVLHPHTGRTSVGKVYTAVYNNISVQGICWSVNC